MDIVETSDDAQAPSPRKLRPPRRRPQPPPPNSTASDDSASDATAPARPPHRAAKGSRRPRDMRMPNASMAVLDTAPAPSHHRRPTCIIEEEDDDSDDAAPSGPSRPVSRQTISRRDISPRSAHRYRSTPESRRSPRTSVSDSEDGTDATSDSPEEQVIQARGKHFPPPPFAPAVPAAPPAAAVHASVQERLSRRPEMVYEEEEDGTSRYAPSVARHRSQSRPASGRLDRYRRPRDIVVSGPPSLDETRSRTRSKRSVAHMLRAARFVTLASKAHIDGDIVPGRQEGTMTPTFMSLPGLPRPLNDPTRRRPTASPPQPTSVRPFLPSSLRLLSTHRSWKSQPSGQFLPGLG